MKKGFTMVEILAVFTITAVILLISVPLITSTLKKGNDSAYKEFTDTVFIAAEAYINDKKMDIELNDQISTLSIGDLIDSGYLKSTVKNPKNKKSVLAETNRKILVKVWRDDEGVLNYEIEGF